jgi:hypothetical protein
VSPRSTHTRCYALLLSVPKLARVYTTRCSTVVLIGAIVVHMQLEANSNQRHAIDDGSRYMIDHKHVRPTHAYALGLWLISLDAPEFTIIFPFLYYFINVCNVILRIQLIMHKLSYIASHAY